MSKKKYKRIKRAFPKKELRGIHDRLKAGDTTALPLWCKYFEVFARIDAATAVDKVVGRPWEEERFDRYLHVGWIAAAREGEKLMSDPKLVMRQPENYVRKSIIHAIAREDMDDRLKGMTNSRGISRCKNPEPESIVISQANRDVWEDLNKDCSSFQRELIERLRNGETPDQIEKEMNRSKYQIDNEIAAVGKKYLKRLNGYGEKLDWLERRVKTLANSRPRNKQSNDWPRAKVSRSPSRQPV
ncbi:hypothetical protein [Lacipirellula sp.]|uniref:hypothetical protein n=1 Tax=Lacipirellula sp. TaxID=2691419 RepID=UPI003D141A40